MKSIDRRTFFKASAVALAGAAVPQVIAARAAVKSGPGQWQKAFMLGNVTKGSVLPAFQLLKEAGFAGVELISPSQLDHKEVLAARDKTGLV
ncbi:MAG: sugar phosphate isomerase, partial [Isosphaeraceae bacterium]